MVTNTAVSADRELMDRLFPDTLTLYKKDVCVLLDCKYSALDKKRIPWRSDGTISKTSLEKWLNK